MPAYNCAAYIQEAIASVLNQSYSNFELIIWDDGSTDETKSRIHSIKDPRITIYHNTENTGYPAVMNSLFSVVCGEFVMIHDADDISHPERIGKLATALEENPLTDLAGSQVIKFNSDGQHTAIYSELSVSKLNDSFISFNRPDITFGSLMMRRDVTKMPFRNLMFVNRAQDIDWLFRVSEKHRFINCGDQLYYYRQHDQSMSNANKSEHLFDYFFWEYICFITQFRREKGIDLLDPGYEKEVLSFLNALIIKKKRADPVFWERHLAYRAARNRNWSEALLLSLYAIKRHPLKRAGYQCMYKILPWNFK